MNLFRNSVFAILGACLLWSCAEKQNYLTALPADTQAAFKINPGVIFDKTALADNSQFQGLLMTAGGLMGMAIKDPDALKTAQAIIKSPSDATGIDFNKPFVVTASSVDNISDIAQSAEVYVILPVKDKSKLAKAFDGVADLTQQDNITTGSYTVKDLKFNFGFNDYALVVSAYSTKIGNRISELLSQTEVSVSNKYFDAFIENDDDIVAWFDMDSYMNILSSIPGMSDDDKAEFAKAIEATKGGAFMTSTNASWGCLSWTFKSYTDKEQPYVAVSTAEILKKLPANSTIAWAFKYDRDVTEKGIKENVTEEQKNKINESLAKTGLTFDQIMEFMYGGIGGSFIVAKDTKYVISISGFDEKQWNTFINCTNLPVKNLEYSYDGTTATIKTPGYTFDKDLTDTRIADIIGECGMAVDFTKIDGSAIDENSKAGKILKQVIGLLDYAQFVGTEDNRGATLDIIFNSITKNALQIIAEFALSNINQ